MNPYVIMKLLYKLFFFAHRDVGLASARCEVLGLGQIEHVKDTASRVSAAREAKCVVLMPVYGILRQFSGVSNHQR